MLPALAAAGALGGFVGGIFNSNSANKKLDDILARDPMYTANPIAAQQYGMAKTILNARTPGATYAQGQISQNEANSMDAATRNATDGSQLLATGGALEGMANRATLGLAEQEAADYQRRFGNVIATGGAVINEGDKVHQDAVRRMQDEVSIRGQQAQNKQNVWNSLTNLGMGALSLGASASGGGTTRTY